jgi:hypothetical protein
MQHVVDVERDRILSSLATKALRKGQLAVELDDGILERLQREPSAGQAFPATLELCVSIAASSARDIEDDSYMLVVSPQVAADPAGRLGSQLAYLFSSQELAALREIVRAGETPISGVRYAEIVCSGCGTGIDAVSSPAGRKWEIVLSGCPSVVDRQSIPANKILVGVVGERFYLTSGRRGEVVARSTNLANTYFASNVHRFLDEVSDERTIHALPFDWGGAAKLARLPRVCHRGIVFRPAQWRIPRSLVTSRGEQRGWVRQVSSWRARFAVPRWVYLSLRHRSAEPDDRVLLDLADPASLGALRAELQDYGGRARGFAVQEMLPGFHESWLAGREGRRVAEFVVHLRTTST